MIKNVLWGILITLLSAASIACFVLGGIAHSNGHKETADRTPAATARGTLPSKSPEKTPAPATAEPSAGLSGESEQPEEPIQQEDTPAEKPTQASEQTEEPEATTNQTDFPSQTQEPVQLGGTTVSNGDGTYTHDFSGGRVLITTESNNSGNPVYHTRDCSAAKKIKPENVYWYDSAEDATENRGCASQKP